MKGSGVKLTIHGYSSIAYCVQTDNRLKETIKVKNQTYVNNLKFCLPPLQQIVTDEKNNRLPEHERTKMIINASSAVLLLDKRTKTKTIMHRREMLIPVMECDRIQG